MPDDASATTALLVVLPREIILEFLEALDDYEVLVGNGLGNLVPDAVPDAKEMRQRVDDGRASLERWLGDG